MDTFFLEPKLNSYSYCTTSNNSLHISGSIELIVNVENFSSLAIKSLLYKMDKRILNIDSDNGFLDGIDNGNSYYIYRINPIDRKVKQVAYGRGTIYLLDKFHNAVRWKPQYNVDKVLSPEVFTANLFFFSKYIKKENYDYLKKTQLKCL